MKLTIKYALCLSLLLGIAAGCGKDGGGGGGSAQNPYTLPGTGLATDSQTALNNVSAWYNSTTEGSLPALNTPVSIVRRQYVTSQNGNCQQKSFLGIKFQVCSYNSQGQAAGTEISRQTGVILTNPGPTKSSNAALAEVFSGAAGTVYEVRQTSSYVYVLNFINQSNGTQVSYTIDTSVHSSYNPVIKSEMVNGQVKVTVSNNY